MDIERIKDIIRDVVAIPGEYSIDIAPHTPGLYNVRLWRFFEKWGKAAFCYSLCSDEILEDEDTVRALFECLAPGIVADFADMEISGPPLESSSSPISA